MEIKDFIKDNQRMAVQVTPDIEYELKDVIEESHRLFNSKYQEPTDASGLEKIYYNIIWIIYRTIMMFSDIDLKDMNMRSTNGKGIKLLSIVRMAVRSHLLRTGFGTYVDKALSQLVWFGTSLTKRVDDKLEVVDLRNYITQADIRNPQERSHAELVKYSYDDMQALKNKMNEKTWQEVEELWEKTKKEGLNYFSVIEFWTWDEIDGENHKVCIKYLDRELNKPEDYKGVEDWTPYLEIDKFITPYKRKRTSKRLIKKLGEYEELFPYEQVNFFDVPGRWLGMGCAELLAGIQEHYNEKFSLYRKKDILDLRGIFIHKYTNTSNSLTQEFLENLETGDVLSMDVGEDLQRLAIDSKTGDFINSIDKLYEIARLIMGVTAQGTGEELPSSTTATVAVINQKTVQTTYDYVREKMHHFLVGIFRNGYIDTILDELDEKELVTIIGDPRELRESDTWFVEQAVNREFSRIYEETGKMPTEEEYKELKEAVLKELEINGDMRFVQLKKEILKDIDYIIEFYVTNEGFDKNIEIQTLQYMKNDTQLSTKAIDAAILDLLNKNPKQFEKTEEEKLEELKLATAGQMAEQKATTPPPALEANPEINNSQAL